MTPDADARSRPERQAHVAAHPTLSAELRSVRIQVLVDAAAALFVLVVATVLAVYRPRGVTRYGWRKAALNVTR